MTEPVITFDLGNIDYPLTQIRLEDPVCTAATTSHVPFRLKTDFVLCAHEGPPLSYGCGLLHRFGRTSSFPCRRESHKGRHDK
jgi:hypothetical protein